MKATKLNGCAFEENHTTKDGGGNLEIDRATAVAFSGYRPEKFPFALDEGNDSYLKLCNDIEKALLELLEQGYQTYLCGMARGFDLLCGKILLGVIDQDRTIDVKLVVVLPFKQQSFSGHWGELHRWLRARAEHEVVISPKYSKHSYHQRNSFMIENSSCLVCYWDGQEGGTASTVRVAMKQEHSIFNMAEK